MGIVSAECDRCNKALSKKEVVEDYDNQIFCKPCYCWNEWEYHKRIHADKLKWLKETHIRQLKETKKKINELKAELRSYSIFVD